MSREAEKPIAEQTNRPRTLPYREYLDAVREASTEPLDQQIERETETVLTNNDSLLLSTGPDAFRSLDEQIGGAQKSIQINLFSWAADSSGMRIANKIAEAKKRNPNLKVDIRLDKLGCIFVGSKNELKARAIGLLAPHLTKFIFKYKNLSMQKLTGLMDDPNSIYNFSPEEKSELESFVREVLTDETLMQINPALAILKNTAGINLMIEDNGLGGMDHSKVFIFDDTTTISGGMNIGDEYSGGYEEGKGWTGKIDPNYWKDYMVKTTGPASNINRNNFFSQNEFVPDRINAGNNLSPLRVLRNSPGDVAPDASPESIAKTKQITYATMHLIDNAQSTIVIEHAYIMDQQVVDKLKAAAGRGVKITILRSQPESEGLENANNSFFRQLDGVANVDVIKFPRVSHTKLISVDGRYSIIGSANLSRASLRHHEEVSYMVSGDNPLQRQIQESLRAAVEYAKTRSNVRAQTSASLAQLGSDVGGDSPA